LAGALVAAEFGFGSSLAAAADSLAAACPAALESAVADWLASAVATCT